jgi:hypothetical protein
MQFMLAMVGEESGWEIEPGPELEEMLETMGAYNRKLAEAGALVEGTGLNPPSTAKTATFKDGEAVITDGPFAEAKEHLAGYWIIQVDSEEEALDWVKQVPIPEGKIEVRQAMGHGEPITMEEFERNEERGNEALRQEVANRQGN